jgi:hypothetical protein
MGDETEAFKEGAKAVQEVAKATGKIVDASRGAGGWLDRMGRALTRREMRTFR